EEAYELEEAILNEDEENLKEELGDLLFQTVLHSEIARQEGRFDIDDVIKVLNHKMTSRHPHVFSDTEVKNSKEVVQNWEAIKAMEKPKDVFDIPATFPALLRSHKIGKRTKRMDFDWDTTEQVISKVKEELKELEEAIASKDQNHIEEEMGDLLFTTAQLSRHLGFDSEKTLRLSNEKFVKRFKAMMDEEPEFTKLSRKDKEKLWNKVKSLPQT
ncbi:MAG: nucleoside triphosphate pyrophosphohydrolase, partial [Bdellovibrionales bacterium]|nr:nucleoside triphosphate pyrophosphohydrolase [Bdellovibrionales bacterium]NQZ19012.1 nucleoside triphosphate pyrophosphohydrolase [Bdellovibrionales bacterium]